MPVQDSDRNHPFIAWWAGLKRLDAITYEGKDLILSDLGGKRFAVGKHKEIPLLCWLPEDREAMESIKWTSAAIAYGLRGRDWIALSASDARIRDSAAMNPVPARVFIPVTAGRLLPWQPVSPQRIALGTMAMEKGTPVFHGDPSRELPLKLLAK